jgi:transposase
MSAPLLSKDERGMLDNLAAHKLADVEEVLRTVRVSILYLPP